MASVEIAEMTGKRHDNVLADCNKLYAEYQLFSSPELSGLLNKSTYKAKNGKSNPVVVLLKEFTLDLVTGYNLQTRNKINTRWQELEEKPQLPQNFAQALRLAADLQDDNEKLQKENQNKQKKRVMSILQSWARKNLGFLAHIHHA